ncbi:MAG TPA: PRTRC system protein E [Pseudoduganella sp.]
MSLFDELFTLTQSRHFAMLVSSNHDTGLLTISIMPRALNEADAKFCKDLTLTAKPADFDAGFIEAIGTYRSKIVPLLEQAKEAAKAIDKTAETAKTTAVSKPNGKANPKAVVSKDKPSQLGIAVESQAQAYREASSGEAVADEDLNNDWMKNRQPELF